MKEETSRSFVPRGEYPEAIVGIYGLSLALYRLMTNILKDEDIYPAQIRLLRSIDFSGERGATVTELSHDILLGTKQNISANLKRLEKRGLVSAERDPSDARLRRYHLTLEGAAVLARFLPKHKKIMEELIGALDETERETLAELIRKLTAKLEEMGGN